MKRPSSTVTLCEETPVVVLAGGKGTRLAPYTTVLPKPLMPVGSYPILEILLRQLRAEGFRRVTLAVGHMAALIEAYFRDGADWGIELSYSVETTPLGTAGPIAALAPVTTPVLVLNGDLLTTLRFADVLRFHNRHQAAATIAMTRRRETVDFGVIESGRDGHVQRYIEKPSHDYAVSMGIYVFSPAVQEFIPTGSRMDFPDLVSRLLQAKRRVMGFETDAYWLDIGRPADYERANDEFPKMESTFLRTYVATAAVGNRV